MAWRVVVAAIIGCACVGCEDEAPLPSPAGEYDVVLSGAAEGTCIMIFGPGVAYFQDLDVRVGTSGEIVPGLYQATSIESRSGHGPIIGSTTHS